VSVRASVELWRTQRRDLRAEAKDFPYHNAGSWTMRGAQFGPPEAEAWESPDVVDEGPDATLVWYHRNAYSIVPFTLRHQGLESVASLVSDPLLNRTFGCLLSGNGFIKDSPTALRSVGAAGDFELRLVAHSAQTETAAAWREQAQSLLDLRASAQTGGLRCLQCALR
jgi:hypothetical protein